MQTKLIFYVIADDDEDIDSGCIIEKYSIIIEPKSHIIYASEILYKKALLA
jgi:hypothetical protein